MSDQQAPQRPRQPAAQQTPRPTTPQQGRKPRSELTRDEFRAHLANVESQVKSALRIIASESKGSQQAHSALRADLSSALVRLQSDMNGSASELSAKIDRLGAEVSFLSRQRRVGRIILATFGMTLSFVLGVLVIVTWLLVKEGVFQNTSIPLPIEDMLNKGESSGIPEPVPEPRSMNAPSRSSSPDLKPEASSGERTQQGNGLLPLPVERRPLSSNEGGQSQSGTVAPKTEANRELPPNLLLPGQSTQ